MTTVFRLFLEREREKRRRERERGVLVSEFMEPERRKEERRREGERGAGEGGQRMERWRNRVL